MSVYLYVILAYLLVLTGYNIYRSRQIKSQEDFMVAGRSLSLTKMVFTLVCTWIGSGTFIATWQKVSGTLTAVGVTALGEVTGNLNPGTPTATAADGVAKINVVGIAATSITWAGYGTLGIA